MPTIAFTAEQKRLINSYYPNLGVVPPNIGSGGLLGVIESTVNEALEGLGDPVAGAAAGTGVTAADPLVGQVQQVVLTLEDAAVPLADNAGVVAYGSLKVFDFPAGNIMFLGAVADLDLTKSSAGVNATWDGDIALGTTAADNTAALATTEQNLCPTTATPQAVAGVTTGDMKSTSTEAAKVHDGTATPVDAYLNILVDDADHDVTGTACNIIVNGTIKLTFINLGDL
jgi:hypothetical protein